MTVFVTGATGFIAGHCIEELLTHGYPVRASVRNLATADVAYLRAFADRLDGSLEFVQATLDTDDNWDEALAGCEVVWHVASPNPKVAPRHEEEVIRPAVDGTLRVLRAAANTGTVRRVVMTSSSDAVTSGHPKSENDTVRTEADWSIVDKSSAYAKSKTLAERTAWEFVKDTDLELVTIIPSLVLGPVHRAETSSSLETIRLLLGRGVPLVPKLGFAIVDVRDVATAHRLATESPAAAGQRYIIAGQPYWMGEIAQVLSEEFASRGYKIPTRHMPYALMRIVALFDRTVKLSLPYVGRPVLVSSDKAERELSWKHRPARESITEAAESLLDLGVVARSPSDKSDQHSEHSG